jgi:hypothetical protein
MPCRLFTRGNGFAQSRVVVVQVLLVARSFRSWRGIEARTASWGDVVRFS